MNEDRYLQRTTNLQTEVTGTACKHEPVVVPFNREMALTMSSWDIRETFPRFSGRCPQCGNTIVKYASHEHYTMGEW